MVMIQGSHGFQTFLILYFIHFKIIIIFIYYLEFIFEIILTKIYFILIFLHLMIIFYGYLIIV